MQYRPFGRTGINISTLGFGAMRLPGNPVDGKTVYDEELGIQIDRKSVV